MKLKLKTILGNPYTITITGVILSFLLTLLYDFFTKNPFLSTLNNSFSWALDKILQFLNYNVKMWWLIVVIASIIVIKSIAIKINENKVVKPNFLSYREGTLKKWKWTWDYQKNFNKWEVTNLVPYCPNCDTKMLKVGTGYFFSGYKCPRCEIHFSEYDSEEEILIRSLIEDNIIKREKNIIN